MSKSSKVKAGASHCGLDAVEERLRSEAFRKLLSRTKRDFGRGRGLRPVGLGRGARRDGAGDIAPVMIHASVLLHNQHTHKHTNKR